MDIKTDILNLAKQFGFSEAKVANMVISHDTQTKFKNWLNQHLNGDMYYLENNIDIRFNPQKLYNNTLSIICVKLPYLTDDIEFHKGRLSNNSNAYISSYALGRNYHKVLKQQLNKYAIAINQYLFDFKLNLEYRAFTDSAPIMEVELANNAGLGFRGKNTLLLNTKEGSLFFLGELFTNLLLAPDKASTSHCGSCQKCLDICPTKAFIGPYQLDATKCISYLTIENKGAIPIEYRKQIGNRIYGCDDCQLFCPWNKFSQITTIKDFDKRHGLDKMSLLDAIKITKLEWQQLMQGSPIYRIGYDAWVRNLAVAIGNAPYDKIIIDILNQRLQEDLSDMVKEHLYWAKLEQLSKSNII
jgi:epoxyqueuosine reductase